MMGKSYAKIAIVGFVLCLAMVLCASFARYRSEQSFIDGAENGFGIDGMYVNDGATGPSMAILAGEDMEWQICNDDGSCLSGRLAATSDPNSFDLLDNDGSTFEIYCASKTTTHTACSPTAKTSWLSTMRSDTA